MADQKQQTKKGVSEIQLVIFRLAGEEYGLDIAQVREIIRMQNITPMPKAPDFIEGVINLRGQIIAVMDLASRFGLVSEKRTDKARIVVTVVKDNTVGLIVDEVPEVLRISEETIEPTPQLLASQVHADFIRGVGKLTDRLVIILDANKILSHEEVDDVKRIS